MHYSPWQSRSRRMDGTRCSSTRRAGQTAEVACLATGLCTLERAHQLNPKQTPDTAHTRGSTRRATMIPETGITVCAYGHVFARDGGSCELRWTAGSSTTLSGSCSLHHLAAAEALARMYAISSLVIAYSSAFVVSFVLIACCSAATRTLESATSCASSGVRASTSATSQ